MARRTRIHGEKMRFWKKKNPNNQALRLERVSSFNCGHYLNVIDYGQHPRRVYAACFYCQKYALLQWSDTYARTMNRIVGSFPAVFSLTAIIVTIAITIIAILPFVNH